METLAPPRRLPLTRAQVRLLIEASDATLGWDKTEKLRLYAQAGITEYWIVDVAHRRLLIHQHPQAEEYLHVRTWTELESVAPLARPDTQITGRELLP